MTVKVKVLCQFCGAMNEMAPEFVNTGEPCEKCWGKNVRPK